jgi:BirA family biotin operon repressor/biotin-[acetyl-CoA-carboxylase] ligase
VYKNLANTLFVGKNLIFLPSCHSTNQIAYDTIANEPLMDGTLILTDHQTAGRGQMGNTWEASPGKNLTFTLILHPRFLLASRQFELNMAVSLGISDWLSQYSPHFRIKWPNDIFFKDRKMGGILIQNLLRGQFIEHSLVGIGLNINQVKFDIPRAISLTEITGETFDLPVILEDLCQSIESRYLQLRGGGFFLKEEYLSRLYRFKEEHLYQEPSTGLFKGSILDVESSGNLVLQTSTGKRAFQFKEVLYII